MRTASHHLILLCKRLGLILLLYSISRLLFFFINYQTFENTSLLRAFIGGIRFDLSAIALTNLPLIFLSLLPIPWIATQMYQRALLWVMLLINLPAILMNLIDVEYFKFTSKRSTADFFDLMFLSDDMLTLMPNYIKDYWYLLLILAILIILCIRAVKKIDYSILMESKIHYGWQSIALIVMVGLSVLGVRGGIQLRPIDDLSALAYGKPQDIPLIINTPFSIIRSWDKDFLERKTYFSEIEVEQYYSPTHPAPETGHLNPKNVVILIMESFSREYVGEKNEAGYSYTPFLDSISEIGISFEESFANGRTSITALPSILSGIPALMNQPFITSPYSQTPTDALPYLLGKHGYSSRFYHGGQTGTMGFDRYCASAGFDSYHGMEDYPRTEDYDGNWGIFDRPFFKNAAEELSQIEEPFLATLFSLSSHHPYGIPEDLESSYSMYTDELGRSIRYADDALRDFFDIMEEQDMLDNTLFIITADHIPMPRKASFGTYLGCFAIPVVFYDHSGGFSSDCTLAQQTDIVPTVIEYLGIPEPHIAWGKSLVGSQENWSLQYINSFYQLYEDGYLLRYDGRGHSELSTGEDEYMLISDPIQARMLKRLQGMIQQYDNRMIDGKLRSGE